MRSLIILGGFKYHITNKGKNKPFPKVGQGLLNGRLLQSAAMDRTVPVSYTHLDVYKRQH